MLVPAGAHVVVSCGFCFAGIGVPLGWAPGVTLGFCLPSSGPPASTLGVHLWAACSFSVECMLLSPVLLCRVRVLRW